ncbi:YegP family protein [Arthrobacter sp. C152]
MAGNFEVFLDPESMYRFRLLAPDGTVMAVSGAFEDKRGVAAGIAAVRECAGTGLVTDLSHAGAAARPVAVAVDAAAAPSAELPAVAVTACDDQRLPARLHAFALAKGPRRQATMPRWTRAAVR